MTRLSLVGIYIAISVWAALGQKPARLVADGTAYHSMATQYTAGETVVVAEAPFVMRIATPWLASWLDPYVRAVLPDRLELVIEEANGLKGFPGFYAVNLLASAAASALLYWYLSLLVADRGIRFVLMTLWLIQWHGPVRFSYFYPAYIDPLFLALLFAGLIATELAATRRLEVLAPIVVVLTFVAAFSRETALLIPLLFLARHWRRFVRPHESFDRILLVLPFLALLPALLIVRELTTPVRPYDAMSGPIQMIREKPLFTWVLAWFFSFGPATIAVILSAWEPVSRLVRERPDFAVYLAVCGLLGYVGGTDTERILTWAWPVMLVLLGVALQHFGAVLAERRFLAAALALLAMVSSRIFWSIPAGIDQETPMRSLGFDWNSLVVFLDKALVMHNYYANLWSFFGSRALHAAQLAFDLALTAVLVTIIRREPVRR